jgi:GTP-binding protein
MIDAEEGITKQDKIILNIIKKYNKAFIIVLNKIDTKSKYEIKELKQELEYFSNIVDNASIILISAISNQNIKKLLYTISNISYSIYKRYKSSLLTDILNQALEEHQPPMINNRRIRLKFAQQAKSDSLSIIIFGNQTDKLPTSYEKYLKNFFIAKLKLVGVPLRITLSKQKNPFE